MIRRKILVVLCLFAVLTVSYGLFVTALYDRITWAPGLGFGLPFYNSTVEASGNLYLKSFFWDTDNASSVTWRNVHMSTGEEWDALTVNSNVNVTFSVVNNRELAYSVPGVGTQVLRGVSDPLSVTVDGVLLSDSDYTFSGGALTIDSAVSTVDVIFGGSDVSAEDALAVGVLFGVIAIAVCIVFVYQRKRKEDNLSE